MGFFTGPHRRTLHSLKLRDGRKLKYLVEGPRDIEHTPVPTLRDSQLPVIVALHGMYLSAQSVLLDAAPAAQKQKPTDYVVVAVNRPGYHGSSNVEVGTYSYTDFALDIEELVNYLQIQHFAVIGHSSGGPCTLACAALLGPDRVTAYATLGGDPEYAHYTDIEASVVLDCCVGKCLPTTLTLIGPFVCITNVANGLRNDYYVEREPYPYNMDEITQPGLVVLGEKDTLLPFAIAKRNHDRLPQATLQIMPGLSHNQLLLDDVLAMVFRSVIDLGHLRKNTEVANGETTTTTAAAAAGAVKTLQRPTPDKVVLATHILQSNIKNQNKYDIRKTMVNTSTTSFLSEECEC